MALLDRTLGARLSPDDPRDYTVASAAAYPRRVMLPDLPAVRDQGRVGSCVAHSAAEVGDYYERVKMSTDMVYGYRPRYCWQGVGMHVRDALTTLRDVGNVPHDLLPTNTEMPGAKAIVEQRLAGLLPSAQKHRIDSYARLFTPDEVRSALIAGMPVLATTYVYADFGVSSGGELVNTASSAPEGAHCMVIWGYDTDRGFCVQNSWGRGWGLNGFCWMPERMLTGSEHVQELWAVADTRERTQAAIRRTLRQGMRGDDVRELQTRLNGLGWPCGAADGIFGSKTRAAVCLFQRSKGLAADGIVGRLTWAALDSAR